MHVDLSPGYLAAGAVVLLTLPLQAATLKVGPQQPYRTIASAVAASKDGDVISVSSGTYVNDFAEISTRISLVAAGGRVVMRASEDIPNQKGILITDTDIAITGFTFTGAHVSDGSGANGAGIRYQGGNLTVRDCYFHHNQDGLLASSSTGTINIVDTEFAHNGDRTGPGAGYTHNIYVDTVAALDIEHSYIHDAIVGHEIKSRALRTTIANSRILDGASGTASYSIDLPNGGIVALTANSIEQGPRSQNPIVVSYGEEGDVYGNSSLTLHANLLENDLTTHAPTGIVNATTVTAQMQQTKVYGMTSSNLVSGPASQSGTVYLSKEPPISNHHPF